MATKRRPTASGTKAVGDGPAARYGKASSRAKWPRDLDVRPGETRLAAFCRLNGNITLHQIADSVHHRVSPATISRYRTRPGGEKLEEALIITAGLLPQVRAYLSEPALPLAQALDFLFDLEATLERALARRSHRSE